MIKSQLLSLYQVNFVWKQHITSETIIYQMVSYRSASWTLISLGVPYKADSVSVRLGWGLDATCLKKLPTDADAAGLQATLCLARSWGS